MSKRRSSGFTRRQFLQTSSAIAAGAVGGTVGAQVGGNASLPPLGDGFALITDPADPVASSAPAQWALKLLRSTLESRGQKVRMLQRLTDKAAGEMPIVAAGHNSQLAGDGMPALGSEQLRLSYSIDGKRMVAAVGGDARGLMYALTELADRVRYASDISAAMTLPQASTTERSPNRIRSIMRLFASDVEDKPWFYDREKFWPQYLDMLATNRFNRFNLALGLSYDFSNGLRDVYFFFAYPFFLNVPGHNVKAIQRDGNPISEEEQKKNLDTLRFISEQCTQRGIDFMLGLWTHNYIWQNSPNASHTISGLNAQSQGPYCRDALHMLLEACPQIHGVTMRTHGESGVPEGSYDIWKVIMSGITGLKNADGTPRKVELDLHAKTMTQQMIDTAHTTGQTVTISCKFWAEHMGLPYVQSSIRQAEMPRAREGTGLMGLSNGTRSFLRYGIGDLARVNRDFQIIHRVWPGTQRLLLWGDPLFAAEYGRCFNQLGIDGVEFFDPLSFKGRAGSGIVPPDPKIGRSGYSDISLVPPDGDWRKYEYQYRLLGRFTYNPETPAEVWTRQLQKDYGAAWQPMDRALSSASRILPLITTAHLPCAANLAYWPETYVNMSVFDVARVGSYGEVPNPKVFATVSSLDPQMFASITEYVDALIAGKKLPKFSPVDVAQQLDAWVLEATKALEEAAQLSMDRENAVFRRAHIDATIAAGIGKFFAHKLRAGVLWTMFDRTNFAPARKESVKAYRAAREVWASLSKTAGVYASDLTFGPERQVRRHWQERLADIDRDIAGIENREASVKDDRDTKPLEAAVTDILAVTARSGLKRDIGPSTHAPPKSFTRGQPLTLRITVPMLATARLVYRHVHQGETYHSPQNIAGDNGTFSFTLPAEYTNEPYPIQYYFEVHREKEIALFPGFREHFVGTPYFTVNPA